MPYGVTEAGFAPKTLQVIKAELEDAFRAQFGAGINVEPSSVFGQIIGIFAEREAMLWEMAEDVYDAGDPDKATGEAQDAIGALTGAERLAATKSTVAGIATGDAGTVLPAGRVVSVDGSGARFQVSAATLAAATAWAGATAYALGAIATNGGKIYRCSTAGTSAASGGPTGTGSAITDNTVTWAYLGDGAAYASVECEAEEYGPVPAYAGTLTKIETPVSGWASFYNPADADVGRDIETHADYRVRREALLREQGNAALDAIRADVLAVEGVESCTVFENDTASTVDGMDPHSIEVLVQGGDDAAIAKAIWESCGGGIKTCGSTTVSHTDSEGVAREVKISRPTEVAIYVKVNGTKDSDAYPANGDDQIKAAIVAKGAALQLGDDVISSALYPAAFGVSGVVDVTSIQIGKVTPPVSAATVVIGARERAVFDTARVTVNLSAA